MQIKLKMQSEKFLNINKFILAFAGIFFGLNSYALKLPEDFLFGVANAPAHVEDELNDPWMMFAKQGKTKAFLNQYAPQKRLEFWTKPEVEINLAKDLGVNVFRLGIDWQRLVPSKSKQITNLKAVKKYQKILRKLKANNIKVMLTLFHHSLPDWAIEMGGWTNSELNDYFVGFAKDSIKYFAEDIDFLITFNEPNVYSMFSYVTGMWPPGKKNHFAIMNPYYGDFYSALNNMAISHKNIFKYSKEKSMKFKTSVAHNIANYKPAKWYHFLNVWWADKYMNYYFLDLIRKEMDFLGFNYYGAEYLSFSGPVFKDGVLYSDAGRAVDAKGLLEKMEELYFRYGKDLFITENGAADSNDYFRSYYLIRHLEEIQNAIKKKIPVLGYIHWTLTDNFEWSDGYCPKFGLVRVDRENNLKRVKRESFYVYKDIISRKLIDKSKIQKSYFSNDKKLRDICRDVNGVDALNSPVKELFKAYSF